MSAGINPSTGLIEGTQVELIATALNAGMREEAGVMLLLASGGSMDRFNALVEEVERSRDPALWEGDGA